jgi:hypothetical protein
MRAGTKFFLLVKVEPPTGGTTLRSRKNFGTMEEEEERRGEDTSRAGNDPPTSSKLWRVGFGSCVVRPVQR